MAVRPRPRTTHEPPLAARTTEMAKYRLRLTHLMPAITALAILCIVCIGCGVSFEVKTPRGFVKLEDQEPQYDYRAVSAEGVVIAVREIEHKPKGDTSFWITAIRSHMREMAGYALLEEKKVTTKSGLNGTQLSFGHDENGETMLYNVVVFVTEKYIFLLEFGGSKKEMDRQQAQLASVLDNFKKK